ncbi:MAG: nitronate monooxygenase [Alphaproteobacteria bacterium]|nr:nitronate monooxygenase [Alphaproteobacteria bacterium]
MWPNTQLLDLLGIDHPIIQAPMAGATTPALAAAVSNAGGMGSLGCAFMTPERTGEEIAKTMMATNRSINVNFFVHEPPGEDAAKNATLKERLQPYFDELGLGEMPAVTPTNFPFDEAMMEVMLELRPRVVSFHFGLPAQHMVQALKEAGVVVLSSATTVREAVLLADGGVDAIVAQGWEAGGHRGTFASTMDAARVGTMALVPQIVDAVNVPVIAAGGIGDGRGIAAAFALGAAGVQPGTAFLTTEEAATPAVYRKALLEASDEDTRLTRAFSGRPARGLSNRYIEEMAAHDEDLPDFPLLNTLTGPLRKASTEAGSPDFVALWSGQAMSLNRTLPAGELLEKLVEESLAILNR